MIHTWLTSASVRSTIAEPRKQLVIVTAATIGVPGGTVFSSAAATPNPTAAKHTPPARICEVARNVLSHRSVATTTRAVAAGSVTVVDSAIAVVI